MFSLMGDTKVDRETWLRVSQTADDRAAGKTQRDYAIFFPISLDDNCSFYPYNKSPISV
jgi:hypothetical protein